MVNISCKKIFPKYSIHCATIISILLFIFYHYKLSYIDEKLEVKASKKYDTEIINELLSVPEEPLSAINSSNKSSQQSQFMSLVNILDAEIQPENGQNIFFLETARIRKDMKDRPLTTRQACSVESAGDL